MFESLLALLEVSLFVALLYTPITFGLAISFRLLNYPDLTCEGSFMLGGAVALVFLQENTISWLSLPTAFLLGVLAGIFTNSIHAYLKVSRLLSGIITSAIAYSLTIRFFSGKANAKAANNTIFEYLDPNNTELGEFVIVTIVVLVIFILLSILFKHHTGRILYALGDDENFVTSLGYNPKILMAIGLGISNGIIGLCGGLIGHHKAVFDVNMGFGILIGGLASLVLGETVFAAKKLWQHLVICFVGTWLYNIAIGALYFKWNISIEDFLYPSDVRMVAGILLLVPALLLRNSKGRYRLFKSEW